MHKKIVALGALALLFGIREANALFGFCGSSKPVTPTELFLIDVVRCSDKWHWKIQLSQKKMEELPKEIKEQIENASPAVINKNTDSCLGSLDKANYRGKKLLLQELFKKNPILCNYLKNYALEKVGNPWFVLLDIDPQFFDHLQNFGFEDKADFTRLTKIEEPSLFAILAWVLNIGQPSFSE